MPVELMPAANGLQEHPRTAETWPRAMRRALRVHWPEYAMEGAELGLFMLSACLFTAVVEHPGSPVRQTLSDPFVRRVVIGIAMGLTAIGIVYSPWGKRSGAHFNPAFTLVFYRLGKIAPWDALFYATAHFAGAVAGVLLSALLLGPTIRDTAVNYAVTVPGRQGVLVAFAAEMLLSFGVMLLVLIVTNRSPRIARLTGLFVGLLVAAYITLEAPLSGMSMNPARTFGSAFPAQVWTALWIYFTAPPLGMLLAAALYPRLPRTQGVRCAKLHHQNDERCIFCEYHGGKPLLLPEHKTTVVTPVP